MSTIKDNKYIWIAFWMWLSFLTPNYWDEQTIADKR